MLTAHSTLSFPGNTNCKTWKDCLEQLFEDWGVNSSRQIKEDQNSNTTEVPVSLPWLFPLVCPKTELNTLPAGTRHRQRARRCPVALAQGAGKKTPDIQRVGEVPHFFPPLCSLRPQPPRAAWGNRSLQDQNSGGGEHSSGFSRTVVPRGWGQSSRYFFLSLVFLSVFLYCLNWGCGHRCGSSWWNRIMKSNFLVKKGKVWWN